MRLAGAFRAALGRGRAASADAGAPAAAPQRVTWEVVQAVLAQGRYQVRDRILAVAGLRTYRVGDRVPVGWVDGAPRFILGHWWRKAAFAPSYRFLAAGLVEELLVANLDDTTADVWYRNHETLVKVGIRRDLGGHAPQAVKWGLDGRSFAVQCADGYYAVCALDREDLNILEDDPPGAATVVALTKPLDSSVPLVTVTYTRRVTKAVKEWVAKFFLTMTYLAVQSSWYSGGFWYWQQYWGELQQGWETALSASGSAEASASRAFPLREMLAGTLVDFQGQAGKASAEVLDWYLDADRHLRFLLSAEWDYFAVGTAQTGTGTVTWPIDIWVEGNQYVWGPRAEQISVGGGLGVIGAKRQSDQQTISERHLVLFDGTAGSVAWSTAPGTVTVGSEQRASGTKIVEHHKITDPGYECGSLPNPKSCTPKAPSESERYYAGASWNAQTTLYEQDGGVRDHRVAQLSSTGTFQLFDPARLAPVVGPFMTETALRSPWTQTFLGSQQAVYRVTGEVESGSYQRTWHYRVQSAQLFAARVVLGTGDEAVHVDAPRLFVILERYPYLPGTAYIGDLPETWVGIVDASGAVLHTLRDWQAGLNAGATRLLTGNGHRVVWVLGQGALQPSTTYRVTDLDTGAEQVFTAPQLTAWLSAQAQLYPPDFLWDRAEAFDQPAALPDLTVDAALSDVGGLVPIAARIAGSIRIVNDEATLEPLDRYQAT